MRKSISKLVVFFSLVVTAVGCSSITAKEVKAATPTVTPIATPTPIPYSFFSKEYNVENYGLGNGSMNSTDANDMITKYSFKKEMEPPYFVGRNDSTATNFSKNNEHDAVLYLGKPMYLATAMDENVYYVSVSDETVAKIDGEEIIPLKQGTFILTTYDKEGKKLEDIKYVVTTYNDSKTPEEIIGSVTFPLIDNDVYRIGLNKDLEYWEVHCSTIMDVSLYFQARGFYYSSEGEPEINGLNGSPLEDWMWNNSVETIFEANKGVCLQAAQMAVHLLANDFEDWGVFMVDGNQGHIFNWFYEDERYYVFDYTNVISWNAWNRPDNTYRDFTPSVQMFESYEDMIKWVKTSGKVDLTQNYLIYEYSLQGYDTLPANINTGKYSSRKCLAGEYEEIVVCFQDIIMKDLKVIYNMEGINVRFQSVALEDMPSRLPHGVFGRNEDYRYYYDYHK